MKKPLQCSVEEMIEVVRNAGFCVRMVPMVEVQSNWRMFGPELDRHMSYQLEDLHTVYEHMYVMRNYDPFADSTEKVVSNG